MIPMSCPSCGRRGNVPLDRLNTQMHCKKCNAFFYLDASGKPVLGEPPSLKAKGKPGEEDRANEPPDYIGMLFNQLVKIPKPIWLTLAVGLTGYVLWIGVLPLLKSAPLNATQLFTRRAKEAVTAFLNKDGSALSYMATPGTENELKRFAEEHRVDVGDGKTSDEGITIVAGDLPAEINATEAAESNMSLIPAPSYDGTPNPPPYVLRLFWIFDKGKLMLDGKKTLAAAEEDAKERAKNKKR